jgi:hypothetical protein
MKYEAVYTHKGSIDVFKSQIKAELVTIDKSRSPVKRLELIVDTGAFVTLINKGKAEENGYKIIEERGLKISGFTEKGLLCDLRLIPVAVFCGFRIENAIIATPHHNDIAVTEVLGMNILENFSFGFDFEKSEIYLAARKSFISQKPRYACGDISNFQEVKDESR